MHSSVIYMEVNPNLEKWTQLWVILSPLGRVCFRAVNSSVTILHI